MKRSNRLLILIGVFLAIIAMIFTIVFASRGLPAGTPQASATPTPTPMTTVVYAKTAITMGQTIDSSMVDVKQISVEDKKSLQGSPFTKAEEVIGLKAGASIVEGAYVYADRDISHPGSIILGQDIAPSVGAGLRGVAVEVDQVNGVGTLVVPGDRVDVILSVWYDQLGWDNVSIGTNGAKLKFQSGQHVTTKLVIQNRKVIATLLPAPEPTKGGTAAATPSAAPTASAQTVTLSTNHMIVILEVSPQEAEVIRWGQREEKQDPQNYITLGLALRSPDDNEKVTTQGITFAQLVKFYGVMPVDARGTIPADLLPKITW